MWVYSSRLPVAQGSGLPVVRLTLLRVKPPVKHPPQEGEQTDRDILTDNRWDIRGHRLAASRRRFCAADIQPTRVRETRECTESAFGDSALALTYLDGHTIQSLNHGCGKTQRVSMVRAECHGGHVVTYQQLARTTCLEA